ncbi:MAG: hypothetical protein ACJ8BW_20275 [Ktedonobacteraceae bacterium]
MITEHEQEKIRLLSETELYPQAVEFMHGIARQLPQTQINGLLNVSLANTYDQLERFIERQRTRTTWRREDVHIPDFYKRLSQKLKQLEAYALSIMKSRTGQPSREDMQTLKMLLAREFIQHVLAENAYMGATRAFQNADRDNIRNQGRPQGSNRGPVTRQGRA